MEPTPTRPARSELEGDETAWRYPGAQGRRSRARVAGNRGARVRQPKDGARRCLFRAGRGEGRRPQACSRSGGEGRSRNRRRALGGNPQRGLRQGRGRSRRARSRRGALLSRPARNHCRGDRDQRKNFGHSLRAPNMADAGTRGRFDRNDRRRVAPADRLRIVDDAGPHCAAPASRSACLGRRHQPCDRGVLARSRPEAARRRAARGCGRTALPARTRRWCRSSARRGPS